MTIAGFLITALIVFAVFAVWYYVVQRNKAGKGQGAKGAMANFMTEIGVIEDASPKKGQQQQSQQKGNNGYTASSFEYMGENKAVTDDTNAAQQSMNSQQPVKTAQSSAQIFQSEVGSMGETGQQQQGQQQAQSRVNGVKTAKQSAQVFQSEVGTIGSAGQGQAQGQGQQGAQSQAFQSSNMKTANSSAQIFQSEVGTIGAGQQGPQGQQAQLNEPPAHRAARMELVQGGQQANHQKYSVEAGEIGELGQRLNASVDPQLQPPGATLPSPDSTQLNQQAKQDQQG